MLIKDNSFADPLVAEFRLDSIAWVHDDHVMFLGISLSVSMLEPSNAHISCSQC